MKNSKTRIICESAIFIAMAEILSLIKLYEFPNGGSINLGMLPIILIAARENVLNAGVDINGFRPVTFEELLENNRRFKKSSFYTCSL